MYSIYKDGTKTGAKGKRGSFLSEKKVTNPDLEEGKLYRDIVSTNRADINIGELIDGSLVSAMRRFRAQYLYEEVDPTDLYARLISPDGKQKGRELIENHLEESFPIKGVGAHDKYKYIIEIDGEDVAVSASNVIFHDTPIEKLDKGTIVNIRGIKAMVLQTDYNHPYTRYQVKDVNTGKIFMTKIVDEILNKVMKASMTTMMFDELKDKGVEVFDKTNGYIMGGRHTVTKFGFPVIIDNNNADFHGVRCYLDEENLEKAKKIFSPRFQYKNKIFVLNEKFKKKLLPKREGRRNGGIRNAINEMRID